jgi:hypothetical protein
MDEMSHKHQWMNVDVSNEKKACMIIEETNDMIFSLLNMPNRMNVSPLGLIIK